jgi:hypothetical protein
MSAASRPGRGGPWRRAYRGGGCCRRIGVGAGLGGRPGRQGHDPRHAVVEVAQPASERRPACFREPGGHAGGDDAEEGDPRQHRAAAVRAAGGGGRVGVAVADRGDGGHRPPEGVFQGADGRRLGAGACCGGVPLHPQHDDGGEGDEQPAGEQDVAEPVGGEQPAQAGRTAHGGRQRPHRSNGAATTSSADNQCRRGRRRGPGGRRGRRRRRARRRRRRRRPTPTPRPSRPSRDAPAAGWRGRGQAGSAAGRAAAPSAAARVGDRPRSARTSGGVPAPRGRRLPEMVAAGRQGGWRRGAPVTTRRRRRNPSSPACPGRPFAAGPRGDELPP